MKGKEMIRKGYKLTLLHKNVELVSIYSISLAHSLVLFKEYLNNYDDLTMKLDLIK